MVVQPSVDTIAAIATAQGRGGIGIVRISGPLVKTLVRKVLGKKPVARQVNFGSFLDENGDTLDQGVALLFPAPHSYTGEDVLELQGHGGPAVLQLLLQRCLNLGARLANPGEFTQRAFLNGKLDLAQAESVADLINADTADAARSAMRSLQGKFSTTIHGLSDELTHLRMRIEATLDFPEEEVDAADLEQCRALLHRIQLRLQQTLDTAKQGNLLREGAYIAIAGQPNVGKSSLLNRLAGEEVALVSDTPGTTRDVIRQAIQIRGVPLHIMDMAGLRNSSDTIENLGIERAHQTMQRADVILLLLDASKGVTAEDKAIFAKLPVGIPRLLVFNKVDLLKGGLVTLAETPLDMPKPINISVKTGMGMEKLGLQILETVGWRSQETGIFMARTRHVQALTTVKIHLNHAEAVLDRIELLAEELRLAQRSLSEITGEFTADDLLGKIFSQFCLGK